MTATPITPDSPTTFFHQVFALIAEMFVPVATGILSILLSTFTLWLASKVLIPRAFVPSWNVVLVLFQRADRFFNDLNLKTTGGIVLVSDRETLPLFQPIAWRETRKKSLGTFRYQFRVLMVLLTPLILVISAVITDSRMEFSSPFRVFPVFFWFVSLICLTIHSTGVIAAERIRQTLDALLVAPLTASEIVLEKLAGVRRLIKVLTVPFAVLIVFQAVWTGYIQQGSSHSQPGNLWFELVATSLSVAIYMPLIMWIGFQFGLRMKTQIQAVLCTFLTVTGICVIPPFLCTTLMALVNQNAIGAGAIPDLVVSFLGILSPLTVLTPMYHSVRMSDPMTRSLTQPDMSFPAAILVVHFAFYGMIWFLLRRNAMRSFSRFVRRLEPESK
jgi:ABC-type transport system involved in multi-copper enzyme maturation permease subunit